MKANHYTGKVILLFVLLAFLIFAGTGCADDPMVSYLTEIEEKGIINDIEQVEDDYLLLNDELDRLFEEQLEELSTADIEALRERVDTLIDKQADILAKVSALETSDETVEQANYHLVEAIVNQNNSISLFHVMFDLIIELVMIMEEPDRPGALEDLDRIVAEVEETERKAFEYLLNSSNAIETWESIVEDN